MTVCACVAVTPMRHLVYEWLVDLRSFTRSVEGDSDGVITLGKLERAFDGWGMPKEYAKQLMVCVAMETTGNPLRSLPWL